VAGRRLVSYHDLRRLLLRRYVDDACSSEERYAVEMMRFEDGNFDVECMLMLGERDAKDRQRD
jgi:hypothetical protein